MREKEPFNISLLDVKKFIKDFNVQEVKSAFIRESSSNQFHPEGLFSEEIFGQIASEQRSRTSGYISLNCRVFHPIIFQNLLSIKKFYGEIMAGTSYAVWDTDTADFIRASSDEEGADTGYTFFLKHIDEINFKKNNSFRRNDKIEVVEKYKDLRLVDKMIVIPAGIRDLRDDAGKMEKDSINSLYSSLMSNTRAMTQGADTNPLFDSVHYIIQKKVVEIYDYLSAMVRGKGGFFEGKYQHRNIARATRNVVTATNMDAISPDSPQYHKVDETKVPLYQASKGAANALVYWYKTLFYDQVIGMSSDNVPLIDRDTYNLEYVPIDSKDRDKLLTAEGIEKTIDKFRDPYNRFKPVVAKVTTGGKTKLYYMFMIYDLNDKIFIVRNVHEFKTQWEAAGNTYEPRKMRPITNAEMLYIAAFSALQGTGGTVTRYPVLDNQGIYVSKTHLMSTVPARVVKLCSGVTESEDDIVLPEYPILGKKFVDALMLHPTRLASLGADFDGNCLVGETEIEIRFTHDFIDSCMEYALTEEQKQKVHAVKAGVYSYPEACGWAYAIITLQDIPLLGDYCLDKNGARVYDLPDGIQVLSYKDNEPVYLPVEKITVEDDCSVAEITSGGRTAIVSDNPSVAAFHHGTGNLYKTTPSAASKARKYAPAIKRPFTFGMGKLIGGPGDFVRGFEASRGLANTGLASINPLRFTLETLSTTVGYICGLISAFGGSEINKTEERLSMLYIDTSNDFEMATVRKLLYIAGINNRCETIGKVRRIFPSVLDLVNTKVVIKFRKSSLQKVIDIFTRNRNSIASDVIPITPSEYKYLLSRASELKDMRAIWSLTANKGKVAPRSLVKRLVKEDENTHLSKRAYADDIIWHVVTSKRLNEKRTVYDLIVPDSKVFAVNNGLIVYDTCSWIPCFSKEANEQIRNYLKSVGNYLLPSGDTIASMCDDLCRLSFYALMRKTPELEK